MTADTVLVVAAHPDDEILGCGGTMARHVEAGDDVHVVIVAEGATSRDEYGSDATTVLREAARKAAACLGVESVTLLGLSDNRLDSLDLLDVVKQVEYVFERVRPTVVYTHHYADLNVDHVVVHNAVVTAARPLPSSALRSLLLFEVPSSTGWAAPGSSVFRPSWFVDIEQWLPAKQSALEAYQMEMRDWPHARSQDAVVSLARWRGASVGVAAAEAFELHRHLERAMGGEYAHHG